VPRHVSVIVQNREGTVLELTTAGFEETVRRNDLVLVDFYAPWCGLCTRLAPEYSLLAERHACNRPCVTPSSTIALRESRHDADRLDPSDQSLDADHSAKPRSIA
jgi:thiol-disulfide isomerase/thioredoxin